MCDKIVNRNGETTYIQLAISSKNITDDFRAICDNINQYYPAKMNKEVWQWRIPFKTTTFELGEELDKATICSKLDSCMEEILVFESDLINKFNQKGEIR